MSCSCRMSTLGVFVRSLTGVRLPNTASRGSISILTSRRPPRSSLGDSRHPTACIRTFSAAASRLQNTNNADNVVDALLEKNTNTHKRSETADRNFKPDIEVLRQDALLRSKEMGAILELSPESIAALTQPLQFDEESTWQSQHKDRGRTGERNRLNYSDQEDTYSRTEEYDSTLYRRKIMPKRRSNSVHDNQVRPEREHWQIQKEALKEKFPEGWAPRKRLSPDALEGIRALHAQYPEQYTTDVLAQKFEVSAEAIRRILKSKWRPSVDEDIDRQGRWHNRGKRLWGQMAELGTKPPRRWRAEGIVRDPSWNKKRSGPRTEYPYMPRRPEEDADDDEHFEGHHKKLGDNLV